MKDNSYGGIVNDITCPRTFVTTESREGYYNYKGYIPFHSAVWNVCGLTVYTRAVPINMRVGTNPQRS